MFVDASALVAMLLREPEADGLAQRLDSSDFRFTSPVAVFETVLALMRVRQLPRAASEELVRATLATAEVEIVAITDQIGRAALDAFERYGKGRGHPAQLNMGDCFACGAARVYGLSVLYKGDDFAETDLAM